LAEITLAHGGESQSTRQAADVVEHPPLKNASASASSSAT
jgi:hypothetical protein